MSNWREEHDSEGFPTCNEDREHDVYTDEYDVTYACEFVEGLGWCWVTFGYKPGQDGN